MPASRNILVLAFLSICCGSALAADAAFKENFQSLDRKRWFISSGWTNGDHQGCEWRAENVMIGGRNLRMTINDHGGQKRPLGCAEVHTTAKQGYGLYEARIRSAAGSGLNTGFFTYIGPPHGVPEWDEIDFEFLGKDPHTVSINHFTNGKSYDSKVVQLGFDASQSFHNYAFDWTPYKISWYADKKLIAETAPGSPIPRNPGLLFLTLWSGAKAEDAWMGPFNYSQPVTADVEWVAFTPPGAPCAFPESIKCK